MTLEFLGLEDVLDIHRLQMARYGGADGLREPGLLESALAQPQATFAGDFVHDGLFAMAAAYLFHIVSNHPFLDGNKRTGLLSALVFLDLNGIAVERESARLYDLTMAVAEGRADKKKVAEILARIADTA
jgi:death-on-curing protein